MGEATDLKIEIAQLSLSDLSVILVMISVD